MYELTKYIGIAILIFFVWLCYEFWRAPMMDETTGRIIKPAKTFKDLFKRK
jgi:hypothetical protein